jgi:hypothetical protein
MPDREVVISLKRGVQLDELAEKPGDTLQTVVKSIAGGVRIVDVFSNRRVAVRASDPARSRLENALGDACHFSDRIPGHVL